MRPIDFWGLTFAEFWPLYNAVTGATKPMTKTDVAALEAEWLKGKK